MSENQQDFEQVLSKQLEPCPQPMPIPNDREPLVDMAIRVLRERDKIGRCTYGTPLQSHNGRDFHRDWIEESADQFLYALGAYQEHVERVQSLLRLIGEQADEIKRLQETLDREKAICAGEMDHEIPSYEELAGWLQRVPATWLPGLFSRITTICVVRQVFKEGGIERLLERAKLMARKDGAQ